MYTASPYPQTTEMRRPNWFARSEAWLDERGKPAWIVAMVLGFIFVWPIGLAILAYMIFGKRMFAGGGGCVSRKLHSSRSSTGNSAFDAYKADTLRRLEDEQASFEQFLERLRDAKDKAEFDQFMDERASREDDDQGDENDTPNGQPA
ncbi:DUF2852 domain-containing protein [Aestuariibius insulae]|uniref:DUF2852 domain-containing protein n=1 Tax=Aestuariibius insulae TaxID=2058287 RepID=UPI00345E5BBB